jgi:hypothetical protein
MLASRTIYATVGLKILFSILIATYCISAEVISTDRHLVRYDTGVVYDAKSGLEWYAGPDQGTTWEQAKTWVIGLEAVGGGWRMPSLKELATLYHVGDGVNNITYLLSNSGYWIWAGHTRESSDRWTFSFSYGGEGWSGQAPPDGGRAIAVRIRNMK